MHFQDLGSCRAGIGRASDSHFQSDPVCRPGKQRGRAPGGLIHVYHPRGQGLLPLLGRFIEPPEHAPGGIVHAYQVRCPGPVALSLLCSCADPASTVRVRPMASSTLNSAVPSPAIPGATSVAAADADTLAASQASADLNPVPKLLACPEVCS